MGVWFGFLVGHWGGRRGIFGFFLVFCGGHVVIFWGGCGFVLVLWVCFFFFGVGGGGLFFVGGGVVFFFFLCRFWG